MNEIARKRPANVLARGQGGYLEAPTARALLVDIRRRTAAGELAEVGSIHWDSTAQMWRSDVRLVINPRMPVRWFRVLILIGAGLAATGLLLWLLAKLVSALVGLLAGLIPLALLAMILIGIARSGGSSISVIQRVTIK